MAEPTRIKCAKGVPLETHSSNILQKRINEAVKNNMEKFPERFSWKLTDEESKNFLVENFDQKIWKLVVVDIDVLEFLQNKVLPCLQQY